LFAPKSQSRRSKHGLQLGRTDESNEARMRLITAGCKADLAQWFCVMRVFFLAAKMHEVARF
jgi:hypothetical protein